MKTTHIIFDLDGTLIDSSHGVIEAVNYAFTCLGGKPPSHEIIKASIGYPLEQLFRETTDLPVAELYRHFQIRAADSVVDAAVALEGVGETLEKLKQRGYTMAIATTKIRIHLDRIERKLGWQGMFSAKVGANDVRNVKPSPEAFLLAMELMQTTPAVSLVVGDTVNDIAAAQAIPVRVVAVESPYGGMARVRALRPDHVIAGLPDLLQILENGIAK
jgi:HAD superfamily hydrolase (TIGR01509 family)